MTGTRVRRTAAVVLGLAWLAAAPAVLAADDPYRPQQWALDRIGAPDVWAVAQGAGQVVAVIDSGVSHDHPDLVDQLHRDDRGVVIGRDFVEDDDVAQDELGHGTMVAGVIAAATGNSFGVASVAPRARIMPVRVLDENGEGFGEDVDAGIRWAVDHGATIVNLSLESDELELTGALPTGRIGAPVEAVEYAWDRGVIVVAAAGNSGSTFTDYPDSSPVVLVGATDRSDERASFSDGGRDDLVMAPGVEIVSTWCVPPGVEPQRCDPDTHNFGRAEGTSFAAPHVAAALALLRSTGLGPDDAVARLRGTARDVGPAGRDTDTGYGIVDLTAALMAPVPDPTARTTAPPSPATSPSATATPATPATPAESPPTSPAAPATPSAPSDTDTTTPAAPTPLPSDPPSPPEPPADPTVAGAPLATTGRGIWPAVAVGFVAAASVAVVGTAVDERRRRSW